MLSSVVVWLTRNVSSREELEARLPPAVKAAGAAIAGGVASGAAGAAVDAIFNRRQVPSINDLTIGDLVNIMASLNTNDLE